MAVAFGDPRRGKGVASEPLVWKSLNFIAGQSDYDSILEDNGFIYVKRGNTEEVAVRSTEKVPRINPTGLFRIL